MIYSDSLWIKTRVLLKMIATSILYVINSTMFARKLFTSRPNVYETKCSNSTFIDIRMRWCIKTHSTKTGSRNGKRKIITSDNVTVRAILPRSAVLRLVGDTRTLDHFVGCSSLCIRFYTCNAGGSLLEILADFGNNRSFRHQIVFISEPMARITWINR